MITYTKNRIKDWRELSLSEQNCNMVTVTGERDDQIEKLKGLIIRHGIFAALYSENGQLGLTYDLEQKVEPKDFLMELEDIFYNR